MVTVRLTAKLLKRLAGPVEEPTSPSTTMLGDWYGTIVFARPVQLALFVSGKTLLPIVLRSSPVSTLSERLVSSVGEVLLPSAWLRTSSKPKPGTCRCGTSRRRPAGRFSAR